MKWFGSSGNDNHATYISIIAYLHVCSIVFIFDIPMRAVRSNMGSHPCMLIDMRIFFAFPPLWTPKDSHDTVLPGTPHLPPPQKKPKKTNPNPQLRSPKTPRGHVVRSRKIFKKSCFHYALLWYKS